MNASRLPAFAITFAAAYALIYVLAVENNWALFTYHPALNQWGPLVQAPKGGTAMYWYGWLVTAGLGAFLVGAIVCVLPKALTRRLWSGLSWAVPLVLIVVMIYLLRGYFLR